MVYSYSTRCRKRDECDGTAPGTGIVESGMELKKSKFEIVKEDLLLLYCAPVIFSLTETETETENIDLQLTETETETEIIFKTETELKL